LCPETEEKDDTRTVKATVSSFHVKHPTKNSQGLAKFSGNNMLNATTFSGSSEDDEDAILLPNDLPYYKE